MIVKLKIKEAREKAGLSLRQLEEETGIERHRLAEIEEEMKKENDYINKKEIIEMYKITPKLCLK